MTKRTRDDYEELGRLIDAAEDAVGRVQGMIMHMFSTLDEENRQLPTRYDEKALAVTLALGELRDELDLERRGDIGGPEAP
jgi:hypothetical protein